MVQWAVNAGYVAAELDRGAWATFALIADGKPATRNLHLAFPAPDRLTVEDFHRAAIEAGYRDNGAPGE